jgi:hypothetical protein
MTDWENAPKGFLERWSRKKIEGEREPADASAEAHATDISPLEEPGLPERSSPVDAKAAAEAAPKPEFDLASLPSLDSITAITDIRAFLGPGVPRELARAALRRAWTADPAIRGFKGLAENDWDFTDPNAMPGFGALPEGTDIKKMLAQIFGESEQPSASGTATNPPAVPRETDKPNEIAVPQTGALATSSTTSGDETSPPEIPSGDQQVAENDLVRRNNNIASHNSNSADEPEERKKRRHHGTALPQ